MATRGVIDIGTNSVKLLVAEVAGRSVEPLFESSEQTRLGAGFYETHLLSSDAIARTAEAVRSFIEDARRFQTATLHVIATSAARDAVNQTDLTEAILSLTGHPLIVISGEREADWAFEGVASDPVLGEQPLLVMDIGGGSSEFVLGRAGHRTAARSFQVGSVRLLEKFPPSDPPTEAERESTLVWLRDFLAREIRPFLRQHLGAESPLFISTGGTASILARMKWKLNGYDREKLEGTILSAVELAGVTKGLWAMPLADRRCLPGLPESRADVILTGAAILEATVEALGFKEVRVSLRGPRFGALLHVEKHGGIQS